MSEYRKLVEDFFLRYERPRLDELVVGFSGIDPPLSHADGEIDHEKLDSLLGGSASTGHYHLTLEEWEALKQLLDTPEYDGGYASTAESEYEFNREWWLDGGNSVIKWEREVNGGKA